MRNVQKNYFSWSELTTTDTGLPNYPSTPAHLDNLAFLWRYLNYLRKELGAPIFINSAFRTPAVNKAVGGADKSYHQEARAADIRTLSSHMPRLRSILYEQKGKTIVELIDYKTFFHFAI